MLEVDKLPSMYSAWRQRYTERDLRIDVIDRTVKGDFDEFDPDEENVTSRSPNMIQVALEDTAEAASVIPTIRVQPAKATQTSKKTATRMERVATSYMQANGIDLLIPRAVMDMAAYGYSVWSVTPDFEQRMPLIERRDPRTCYPEPGFRPGDAVRKVMFGREVYYSQLPPDYQIILSEFVGNNGLGEVDENTKVVLVEYYDEHEYLLCGMYQGNHDTFHRFSSGDYALYPVELERIPNSVGVCPIVIGSRITLDGEFRGQFDQVVGLLEAHIRLMSMVLDYADQAVYSDIFVKDLIGEMPYGGGAYIELGPQGAIGRVPPAVSSLNVQADMAQLMEGIHLGGRWPKSRPGEIDQAIASAKFLESSVGMMNTAIRTYHQILQSKLEKALRIACMVDKEYFPGEKTAGGILRNQEFLEEYNPAKDIDMDNRLRVEYGLGMGRDPAQSAVLHIQYSQNEFVSKEFVQENLDGLTDVAREQARIDTEKFRAMALAKLLQGLEQGAIPDSALVEIARARLQGDELFDLFEQWVVKPQEEQMNQMLPAMAGPGLQPGAPMGPGPGGPGGPGGQPMLGPGPPPPPEGSGLLARMGVPAGPGGMIGAEVRG